jgi:hypothetical protein
VQGRNSNAATFERRKVYVSLILIVVFLKNQLFYNVKIEYYLRLYSKVTKKE